MRQRKGEAWTKWRGLVGEQVQSGQSVAAFCRERGLKSGQFFAWKRRLREAEAAKFVAVEVASPVAAKWPASVMNSGAIEVRLAGGRSLVVEPRFDAVHLRALLSVLEGKHDWAAQFGSAGPYAGATHLAVREGDRHALRCVT